MGNSRGSDHHGPAGDPSWLGGSDRGRTGAGRDEEWRSDVSAGVPDADFGDSRSRDMPSVEGPQFSSDAADRTGQGEQASWAPSFGAEQPDTSERPVDVPALLLRLGKMLIPLAIVVVIMLQTTSMRWGILPFLLLMVIVQVKRELKRIPRR